MKFRTNCVTTWKQNTNLTIIFYHKKILIEPNHSKTYKIEQYKAQVNVGDCQGPER